MAYQENRNQLKKFKAQGYENIPALNSKKEVLQSALDQILASIAATETITETITETPVATEIAQAQEIAQPAKKLDFTTTNYYPAFLIALATIAAFLQSLWTKSAPYLGKAIKYIQSTLLPKLALASRFIGLVVLLTVLKVVRRAAIA